MKLSPVALTSINTLLLTLSTVKVSACVSIVDAQSDIAAIIEVLSRVSFIDLNRLSVGRSGAKIGTASFGLQLPQELGIRNL